MGGVCTLDPKTWMPSAQRDLVPSSRRIHVQAQVVERILVFGVEGLGFWALPCEDRILIHTARPWASFLA